MFILRPLLLLLALVTLTPIAQAQNAGLPDWQHTSINDFAGVLTPADTKTIDEALIALNERTGVEGTVVTITDRARYGDSSGLESFATRLFNHWGVGDQTRNDGFMVLLSKNDREVRIELGSGYGADANRVAASIINRVMLPSFEANKYSDGMREGTLAVIERIAAPQASGQPIERPRSDNRFGGLAAFLALSAGLFGLQRWTRRRRNRCPQCGHQGLETAANPIREDLPDGGWRTAMQSRTRRCPSCGWQETKDIPLPVITYYDSRGQQDRIERVRSSRGGSSGFGGGSSSGGGASGRW